MGMQTRTAFHWSGGKDAALALWMLLAGGEVRVDRFVTTVHPERRESEEADPCGEFGEYHSFVFDGPLFDRPVEFTLAAPRFLEREIGTTEGLRRYTYWLARPQPVAASLAPTPPAVA
jgi:diphthamide synthase (EF-2-diphthine--ammonia ligase)